MQRQQPFGGIVRTAKACLGVVAMLGFSGFAVIAQDRLHDPALPTVSSEALHQLSDSRTRQQIMEDRQSHFAGRCVCRYQTIDSNGRSCKGRHEAVRTGLRPLCYPGEVSQEMVTEWDRKHP